jgi:hypothetical protein
MQITYQQEWKSGSGGTTRCTVFALVQVLRVSWCTITILTTNIHKPTSTADVTRSANFLRLHIVNCHAVGCTLYLQKNTGLKHCNKAILTLHILYEILYKLSGTHSCYETFEQAIKHTHLLRNICICCQAHTPAMKHLNKLSSTHICYETFKHAVKRTHLLRYICICCQAHTSAAKHLRMLSSTYICYEISAYAVKRIHLLTNTFMLPWILLIELRIQSTLVLAHNYKGTQKP